MQLELNGKSVLITGGSKGIGLASALQFSRDGAHQIIVSRLKSNLQSALAVFTEERLVYKIVESLTDKFEAFRSSWEK